MDYTKNFASVNRWMEAKKCSNILRIQKHFSDKVLSWWMATGIQEFVKPWNLTYASNSCFLTLKRNLFVFGENASFQGQHGSL